MTEGGYFGMKGVGSTELDFTGQDFDIELLPALDMVDKVWIEVNQGVGSDPDYSAACTIVSSFSAILSIFNHKPSDEEYRFVIDYAISQGYIVGSGRELKKGVRAACNARNILYPEKRVMYVKCDIGDKYFSHMLDKGYSVIMGHYGDKKYSSQKRNKGLVTLKRQEQKNGGHAISTYFCGIYKHCNTYPKYENNIYGVQNLIDLKNDGSYESEGYGILQELEFDIGAILQKKRIQKLSVMSLMTSTLSKDQDEKNMLKDFYNKTKHLLDNKYN